MAGVFDFLHLKHRTAGSSNELSFDVLDAARHHLDSQQKQGRRAASSQPGLGAVHAESSDGGYKTTLSAEDEVRRRKRMRRQHAIRLKALGALAVIAVLCIGVVFSYNLYRDRTDFSGKVNSLVAQIVDGDDALVKADSLMSDPFDRFQADSRTQLLAQLPMLLDGLEQVDARAEELLDQAMSEGDQVTLREISAAAQARMTMLGAVSQAFRLSATIGQDEDTANRIWIHVVDADQTVREAAQLANSALTEDETIQARDATAEAAAALETANAELAALENKVAGLDFTAQRDYLACRIEALGYAVDTSDALLAGDRSAAAAANEEYNRLERQAAAMADELPASVADAVSAAYRQQMEDALGTYNQARAAVTKADADLRSRL